MTLRKGRPPKGSLVDLGIYPDDECYEPPPKGNCESVPQRIDLAEGHILSLTRYYRTRTSVLVYFGINQSILVDPEQGVWRDVARIDCSHGYVHRQQYSRNGANMVENVEAIIIEHAEEVINRRYEQAMRIMQEEWADNVRRWEG